MNIKSALVSLSPGVPAKFSDPSPPLRLQIGQLISARVLTSLNTNQLLLAINGRRLLADTNINAKPGQILTLEVIQTEPTPQLKTLDTGSPNQVIAQQAIRSLLPRQAPLNQVLTEMQSVFRQAQSMSTLPSLVRLPLADLFKALPRRENLTQPESLKSLLRGSGLFHEAITAKPSDSTPPEDLKTYLLRLATALKAASNRSQSLQPTPRLLSDATATPASSSPPLKGSIFEAIDPLLAHLEKKTASALARLVMDQLASLPKNESAFPVWHFEIPYFQGESLERLSITISQESPQEKASQPREKPWSVILELAPENLGEIRVKIIIQGEGISSYFWSEKPTTRKLFEKHFDILKQQLEKAGLQPEKLQTAKILASPQSETPSNHSLINVTT